MPKLDASAELTSTVTADMVDQFATLSGDTNPIHLDDNFARSKKFSGRIAHGMLGGALISQLLGMYLPGKNALYLSQQLFFRKPIYINSEVIVRGTVTQVVAATSTAKIKTEIIDATTKDILVDGEALVKILK